MSLISQDLRPSGWKLSIYLLGLLMGPLWGTRAWAEPNIFEPEGRARGRCLAVFGNFCELFVELGPQDLGEPLLLHVPVLAGFGSHLLGDFGWDDGDPVFIAVQQVARMHF